VNAIHTKARMHEDGNWRVTGVKKWITGGCMAGAARLFPSLFFGDRWFIKTGSGQT